MHGQGTCKITSNEGSGEYKITQMWWDGSAWYSAVGVGLVTADARDFQDRVGGIVSTTPVRFWAQEKKTGGIEILIDIGGAHQIFAVQVTKTAGVAGNSTTLCTYVYTVKDVSGTTELGTSKVPKKWRNTDAKRKMLFPVAGSIGLAYYDESGTIQLFDANEVPYITVCP